MTYPFFDRKERVPQETPALTLHNHTAVSGSHRVAQTHLRNQELLAAHFRKFTNVFYASKFAQTVSNNE